MLYNQNMAKRIDISIDSLLAGTPYEGKAVTVGVAISGGRDSVALLHYLKSSGVQTVAVNVEHGIRGEESLSDSVFVKKLCEDMDVKLYAYSVDVPKFAQEKGYTIEQAARILRYEVFDGLLADGVCDLIALAHHLDDQVETVFMRILRGTGIRGLQGMRKVSGRYIRPFLDYSREDINSYIEANGLKYVEDGTNSDTAYTRNFLRQEIESMKARFPSMGEAVARLSECALEAEEFIEAHTPDIELVGGQAYVKISNCADTLIAKRLILKAANALGVMQDIEDKHYKLVLDLLSAENGKYLMLTHGLCVHKESDSLVFELKSDGVESVEIPFVEGNYQDLGVCVDCVNMSLAELKFEKGALYADADKIPDYAVIRTRSEGDYIHKFGGGSKSLGDFLTDKKVPLRTRDGLKLIADGSRVLAVFGIDISADVKVDEGTKRVYKLTVKN